MSPALEADAYHHAKKGGYLRGAEEVTPVW